MIDSAAITVISQSVEETNNLGKTFAANLKRGDIVALHGELGAGKTQFVKGACVGLGVVEGVSSPSFVIMNEYTGRDAGGKEIPLYHIDLYRVTREEEIYDLGYEEFLFGNGICFIEWSEKLGALMPERRFNVSLKILDDSRRELLFERGVDE
jgi:tRNA threonylcarbamoyladenosine biosynthesis protein TsaE